MGKATEALNDFEVLDRPWQRPANRLSPLLDNRPDQLVIQI